MKIKEYFHDQEGFIFHVQSESNKKTIYTVSVDDYDGWYCTCEDYKFRKHKCKHIKTAEKYIQQTYPIEESRKYLVLDAYVKNIT